MITRQPPKLIINGHEVCYCSNRNDYPTRECGLIDCKVSETKIYNLDLFGVHWYETEEIYSTEILTRHLVDAQENGCVNPDIHAHCVGLRFVRTSLYLSEYHQLLKMIKEKEYSQYIKGVWEGDDIFDVYYESVQGDKYNIYLILMNKGKYGYNRPKVHHGRGGKSFLIAEDKSL